MLPSSDSVFKLILFYSYFIANSCSILIIFNCNKKYKDRKIENWLEVTQEYTENNCT